MHHSKFDWDITNRKLIIFIPNYNRKHLFSIAMKYFRTKVDPTLWRIVIGNDGNHETFEEFKNVSWFDMRDSVAKMRNGGFIRNYFIKRCKSEILFQMDPEIVLYARSNDVIKTILSGCSSEKNIYRVGRTVRVDNPRTLSNLSVMNINIKKAQGINKFRPTYVHWGFGTKTRFLQDIHGYDERFNVYGYEDTEIFRRFLYAKKNIVADYNLIALHISHPDTSQTWPEMKTFYETIPNDHLVANGDNWGEG